MKKHLNFLKALGFLIALVWAHQATAQKREPLQSWKDEFKYHLMSWVDSKDSVAAGQLADKLMAMSATEKSKYFHDHVVVSDQIKVTKAEVLNFTYGTPQLQTVNNAVMPIAFLRLGVVKEFVGSYGDILLPMYTYKGKPDALYYNPDIIAGYDFNGDGTPDDAKYDEANENVVPSINATIPQNSPVAGNVPANGGTTGNGQVGFVDTGKGYSVLRDANGKAILDSNGDQIIQMATQTVSSGGSNPGGAGSGNTTSTAKKATRTVSLEEDGDSTMLAKLEMQGQGNSVKSSRRPASESFTEVDCSTCPGGKQKMVWSHELNDWVPYGNSKMKVKRTDAVFDADGDLSLMERAREEHRMDDGRGLGTSPDSEHLANPAERRASLLGSLVGGLVSFQQPGYNVVPAGGGCNGCNNTAYVYARDQYYNPYTNGSGGGGNNVGCSSCGF